MNKVTGSIAKVGGLAVGQGLAGTVGPATVKRIQNGTVTVDPASITNATSLETAVTITGVAAGDIVIFEPPVSLETGLVYGGVRVSAADTVQLRLSCIAAAPVDGASRTWRYVWFDLT